jgi:hypothetical protein
LQLGISSTTSCIHDLPYVLLLLTLCTATFVLPVLHLLPPHPLTGPSHPQPQASGALC